MPPSFDPPDRPPPGWTVSDGQLHADPTVAGYLARGCEVKGVCHLRDCRRRCELDLPLLVQRGLGKAPVSDLKPLFRCHRLGGCGLEFRETANRDPTLGSLLRHRAFVSVRISCEACRKTKIATLEAVIARLTREGTGGAETPITALAGVVRGRCGCGQKRWRSDVLWYDPRRLPAWLRQALQPPASAT